MEAVGGILGGLFGGSDSEQTQTASKEPWSEAKPWILSNIAQGQQLQDYYTQNPFNQIQQQGLQGTLDAYNQYNQAIPGLLNFSNSLMNTNYQRKPNTQELRNGATATGTTGTTGTQATPQATQAVQTKPTQYFGGLTSNTGATGTTGTTGSVIDWNAMNPLYKDPSATTSTVPSDQDRLRAMLASMFFPDDTVGYRRTEQSESERYLRQLLGKEDNRPLWLLGDGG